MKSKGSASLFLLSALIINAITDSSGCNFTVVVGNSVTIKLDVDSTDELVWKHDSKRVFKGMFIAVPRNVKEVQVNNDGSLVISSVKMEDNGNHDFEAFRQNGKFKAKKSITLCVHEKPPKPTVNITCIDGKPSISCEVKDKTGLTFSWFRDEKKIDENSASLRNIDKDQDYECAVEKPIPSDKSDKVKLRKAECSQPGQDLLLGFERWIMVSVLAGGGGLGLMLLLMIVLVICCACQIRKRRAKRLQDTLEDFRIPDSIYYSKLSRP